MYEVSDSDLGTKKGIIATQDIPLGSDIGVWVTNDPSKAYRYLVRGKWWETAELGRYCNHSDSPNTDYKVENGELVIVSKGIQKGDEILVSYWWCKKETGFKSPYL